MPITGSTITASSTDSDFVCCPYCLRLLSYLSNVAEHTHISVQSRNHKCLIESDDLVAVHQLVPMPQLLPLWDLIHAEQLYHHLLTQIGFVTNVLACMYMFGYRNILTYK